MKKRTFSVIAAICALCAVLVVTGCGGGSSSGSAAAGAAGGNGSFVGNWTNMTEEMLAESDQEIDLEALEAEEAAAEEEADAEAEQSASESADAEAEADADAEAELQYPLVSMFVTLSEDGTAQVAVSGVADEGTWEASGNSATITVPGLLPLKASVSGDTLKLEQDGMTVTLKKTDRENPFAYGSDVDWEEMLVEPVLNDIAPVTIADDDKVTITVTGTGTDYTGDPGYRLSLTNKTQGIIGLDVEEAFTVSGAEVWAQAGVTNEEAEFTVEPGATSTDMFLYFPSDELEGGVEKLVDVVGKISVYDEDQEDYLATYDFKM